MHRSKNWEWEEMGEYLTAPFPAASAQLQCRPCPGQTMFTLLCACEVVPWERKCRTDLQKDKGSSSWEQSWGTQGNM